MRKMPKIGKRVGENKRFIMNKIALIVAILAYSIFAADTLYLRNGKEIKDASIVEIGVSDVKYKVGKKDVLYTVRKSDIAIIFFADGTKETFEAESKSDNAATGQGVQIIQNVQNTVTPTNNTQVTVAPTANAESKDKYENRYENFTTGQRWGTWALNALTLNGLGSWLIMGDVSGGFVHLGFGVVAVAAALNSTKEVCSDSWSGYYNYNTCTTEVDETMMSVYAISLISGCIWNIYRSITHDKPHPKTAYGEYGGFNFTFMPNRYGNLIPAVTYNKTF